MLCITLNRRSKSYCCTFKQRFCAKTANRYHHIIFGGLKGSWNGIRAISDESDLFLWVEGNKDQVWRVYF